MSQGSEIFNSGFISSYRHLAYFLFQNKPLNTPFFTPLNIFLILFILYKDVWNAVVVLSCLPLALVGGLLAMMMRGYAFNVSSAVGFISLFGISVMSGVLYVSRANHLREDHPGLNLKEVSAQAAMIQLRPRLMTMLLAMLGLIPASLAHGVGSDVQRPLATVVVGGLLSSLVLTMVALPILYYSVEKWRMTSGRENSHA